MRNFLRLFFLLISAIALVLAALVEPVEAQSKRAASGPLLSIDDYLKSVREGNEAVQAAVQSSEAASLTASDASLLTSPQAFGSASSTSDERFNPQFRANKILNDNYQLGLQQQTTFGLGAKLYYSLSRTEVPGAFPTFHEARPTLELTQQLWRNGFGSETRAQIQAIKAGARARSESEAFRANSLILDAELAYWRLVLARETRRVQEEALERADRLVSWAGRRASSGLADRADSLQAQANQKARQLELRAAIDAERAAARTFNSARGVDQNDVSERLQPLTQDVIDRMQAPTSRASRGDIKAAQLQAQAAAANSKLGSEKGRASVEIFGQFATNGFDADRAEAIDQSFTTERPTTTIGVRFTVPLDFSAASRSRQGYEKEKLAADTIFKRKTFEEARDWQDVTQKFTEAKSRLGLYQELEQTQRAKLEYERARHNRGRSTTQQVLLYELDYEQAQFGRIRTLAELLQLNAQMKLYGTSAFRPESDEVEDESR
ncbi:MAG: TolC family protein [Bdellovibrionaceae bacterium]|nr:TolC family protein [Pseudobdellovibrionaceae bacterium]